MIRKATSEDIDPILNITKACAALMVANNIFQWNAHYPNIKAFEVDLEREELFVLQKNSEIIGCVTLSKLMDDDYKTVSWPTVTTKNLYVHRLATHPDHQGQGFAQQLMDYAENLAREHGFDSIRLDTFSKNERNQKFYELRGYQKCGAVYFPKQSKHPFYCYELAL